ncbi:phloem protein 2-like protein, partial [Tanacetum coccineum]
SQRNPVNTSKEELNALLSEGILIDQGEKLFSVSKVSMKKCYMLSAKSVIHSSPNVKCSVTVPRSQSRFAEVVEILSHYEFRIKCSIERELLSPNTNYGCFLVYKISEACRGLKGPVNLQYFKWIPAEREDGWMEVIVWEIHSENGQIAEYIPMDMKLTNFEGILEWGRLYVGRLRHAMGNNRNEKEKRIQQQQQHTQSRRGVVWEKEKRMKVSNGDMELMCQGKIRP